MAHMQISTEMSVHLRGDAYESPNIDDRPTCSKCSVEMLCGITEPIMPGYELRNFECPSCGDKLKLVGYAGPIKTISKPE